MRRGVGVLLVLVGVAGIAGAARTATAGGTSPANAAPGTHWAFRPPARPPVPAVKNRAWVRTPVDAFLLAEMERRGVSPSPPADRRTLLRRITLDLTGLLPTPEETDAFVRDAAPDAYEQVVDRLLASPHYGERWAQHWLDVVRFAETNGFEGDGERPQAWRYRDWVAQALNADLPYDRFLTAQIAGDLLDPKDPQLRTATGFLRAGPQHVVGGNADPAELRQEWLTEAVTGVGAGVMGLTVQCARCHDHKFDPIPQADYYRLEAFFARTANQDYRAPDPAADRAHAALVIAHQERLAPLRAAIAAIEAPYRARLREEKRRKLEAKYVAALAVDAAKRSPEQRRLAQDVETMLKVDWDELVASLSPSDREKRAALRKKMHALDLEQPAPLPIAPGVGDTLSAATKTHVLIRGDLKTPGAEVQPGLPQTLTGATTPSPGSEAPRLRLARWLTRPDHPLTARVLVNRVWQHHFGRGLVGTPNDFGRHGEAPTHPALLDWLATTFTGQTSGMRVPFSLKSLHRLLVTSAAYRQSSKVLPAMAKRDPGNRLLWRMNTRRLDAEAVRDAVLQAAGTLNRSVGGPAVRVPLEPEVYDTIFTEGEPDNLWPITPDPTQHVRRSLYLLHKRNVRLPFLVVFDQPDMLTPCGARGESVHALQSLSLLNSDLMTAQSRALALRLFREAPQSQAARVERLFALTLSRSPSPTEQAATERFLRDQTTLPAGRNRPPEDTLPPGVSRPELEAWCDLALATLNRNDFLTWK